MEEHSRGLDGVRAAIVHLEQRMDGRFEAVDRRFEGLERRLEGFERRLDALDQKLDQRTDGLARALEQRTDGLARALDQRTDALRADLGQFDQKVARQFVWLVGAHMTTLLAIVGAVVAALVTR